MLVSIVIVTLGMLLTAVVLTLLVRHRDNPTSAMTIGVLAMWLAVLLSVYGPTNTTVISHSSGEISAQSTITSSVLPIGALLLVGFVLLIGGMLCHIFYRKSE